MRQRAKLAFLAGGTAIVAVVALAGCKGSPGAAPTPTPSPTSSSGLTGASCANQATSGLSGGTGFGHSDHFLSDYVSAPVTGAADVPNGTFMNVSCIRIRAARPGISISPHWPAAAHRVSIRPRPVKR
jgi:hypothetical protein